MAEIFLADRDGYYIFPSQDIKDNGARPVVNFTGLKIGDKELNPATGSILKEPLEKAKEIKLHIIKIPSPLIFLLLISKVPVK